MADIRIKDLTTTASSTASDDFIAVDGTTNGTRKLNAFSPTFGGNATVTGTLTVNGVATASAGISIGDGTFGAGKIYTSATGGLSLGAKTGSSYDFILADPSGNLIAYVPTGTTRMVLSSTTASTTTSTGALVVGNGTSGGLGVGGAANIGGTLTVANTSAQLVLGVDSGSALTYTIRPAQAGGAIQIVQDSATVNRWLSLGGVNNSLVYTESLRITNGGHVAVTNTTASTSTSSGALVVSGGVGVAGNIWTGGQVNLAATSVEASTGINFGVALAASRDIVFFGDGTRGGMLRGYHDGSNIARLGFGYWASSGDTYTSVIDITGSATTSSQLVAIAGTAGSTSTTSGALTVAGGMGVAEAVNAGTFYGLVDGVTAPATGAGYARIYVDSADGDLKVKFGDGTVKTIATDS